MTHENRETTEMSEFFFPNFRETKKFQPVA